MKAIYQFQTGSMLTTGQKSQPDVSDSATPNCSGSLPHNLSLKRSPTTAVSGVNATGEVPSWSPSWAEKCDIISVASTSHMDNNQSRTENVVASVHVSEPERLPSSEHNVESQTSAPISEADRNLLAQVSTPHQKSLQQLTHKILTSAARNWRSTLAKSRRHLWL